MFRHFSGCEEAFPFPYGCFCGPNLRETNATLESVDAFDEACKVHDLCYDQLADDPKHHCHYLKDGYFGHYHWDISQGKAEVSEEFTVQKEYASPETLSDVSAIFQLRFIIFKAVAKRNE